MPENTFFSIDYQKNTTCTICVLQPKIMDIEDICFFDVNTKYISSSELKTSEFSRVHSTSENFMFLTHEMKYTRYSPKKKQIFFLFYTIHAGHFPIHKAGGENTKTKTF